MTRFALLALAGLLTGAVHAQKAPRAGVCVLRAPNGTSSAGEVWFRDTPGGLGITVALKGLTPESEHALRLHVRGDAGQANGSGFGPVFSRRGVADAGELARARAKADGAVRGVLTLRGVKLREVLGLGVTLNAGGTVRSLGVIGLAHDVTPPTIEVLGHTLEDGRARFRCKISDNRAVATFGPAGKATVCETELVEVSLESRAGDNMALFVATDGAGNTREVPVSWSVDATAPTIKILAPKQGQQLSGNPVNVVATVEDPNLAAVTVNGKPASQDAKGRWRLAIQASEGPNQVTVSAVDSFGNQSAAEVSFAFDATPPGVEAAVVIVVEGKVDDLSATLTINGQAVRYDPRTGAYSARIKADPQDAGKVTIVATDSHGNQSTEIRRLR